VTHLAVNPLTQKVWFRAGHANAVFIDTVYRSFILVEPAGIAVIKSLDRFACNALVAPVERPVYSVFSNLSSTSEVAHDDDNLCTASSAIAAMFLLANPVRTQPTLDNLIRWIENHRTLCLRLFFRHAYYFLNDKEQ
jgi:hypothetical protein